LHDHADAAVRIIELKEVPASDKVISSPIRDVGL
jgi:hypothetical protein